MQDKLNKFERECQKTSTVLFSEELHRIGDFCDIGNGMVSGLDAAFQIADIDHLNNDERDAIISVMKAKDLCPYKNKSATNYIFLQGVSDIEIFESKYPHFAEHFKPYIEKLQQRYNYKNINTIILKALSDNEYESYIKAQPEGEEVGHYGDGVTFIDLDGCDRATIYSLELSENDTTDMGGTRYEYKKEEGSYVLNGFRLEMTFPSYGKVIAIYGNRSINFTLDNVTYNLKEPKRYYDSYNWTNFDLYETSPNKGNGIFEMYGSFLTPFTYEIENNVEFIFPISKEFFLEEIIINILFELIEQYNLLDLYNILSLFNASINAGVKIYRASVGLVNSIL